MKCQRCGSKRVGDVVSKCSDLCCVEYNGKEHDGYVPYDMGIGGGDYVSFGWCLDCGQIQGNFPVAKCELEQEQEDQDE